MNYSENEKRLLSIIENNIQHYNVGRRKNKLSIIPYIAGGNRIDVTIDNTLLAGMLSVEETYYFIFGVCSYAHKTGGKKK